MPIPFAPPANLSCSMPASVIIFKASFPQPFINASNFLISACMVSFILKKSLTVSCLNFSIYIAPSSFNRFLAKYFRSFSMCQLFSSSVLLSVNSTRAFVKVSSVPIRAINRSMACVRSLSSSISNSKLIGILRSNANVRTILCTKLSMVPIAKSE